MRIKYLTFFIGIFALVGLTASGVSYAREISENNQRDTIKQGIKSAIFDGRVPNAPDYFVNGDVSIFEFLDAYIHLYEEFNPVLMKEYYEDALRQGNLNLLIITRFGNVRVKSSYIINKAMKEQRGLSVKRMEYE